MDERIKSEYRKIYAGLVPLIILIASASIIIKLALLKWDAIYCMTELVILVFSSVYMFICCAVKGLKNGYAGKRTLKNLMITIIASLVVYFIISYVRNGNVGRDVIEFCLLYTSVSMYITEVSYMGGAHPNTVPRGLTFDMQTGKRMSADDFMENALEEGKAGIKAMAESDPESYPFYDDAAFELTEDDWYIENSQIVFIVPDVYKRQLLHCNI